MTVDGISVGGYEDNNTPNVAKQKPEIIMPDPSIKGLIMWIPKTTPITMGTIEIKIPKSEVKD